MMATFSSVGARLQSAVTVLSADAIFEAYYYFAR